MFTYTNDSHALVSPKEMSFQGRSIAKSLIIVTIVRMSEHVPRLTPCIPQYMSGTHETTSANIVKAKPIFTVLRPQRLPEAQLLACYRTASGHRDHAPMKQSSIRQSLPDMSCLSSIQRAHPLTPTATNLHHLDTEPLTHNLRKPPYLHDTGGVQLIAWPSHRGALFGQEPPQSCVASPGSE